MPVIPIAPKVLTNALLTLGADQYQAHVSTVRFDPNTPITTWKGLAKNIINAAGTSTWVCVLDFAQDWETAKALSLFLLEHEGETIAATFAPEADEAGTAAAGASFTSQVTIVPGSIGGSVDGVPTSSVSLPCTRPVLVPAA